MAVVTVDFDGTLFKGNSFKVMFDAAKKDFSIKEWSVVGLGLIQALGKAVAGGKEAFKKGFFSAFARSFKGKTKEELDTFFRQLVMMGKAEVNEALIERIQNHQEKEDTVIVLSGALRPFLEAFISIFELDVHVIGTPLLFDDAGLCTGRLGVIVQDDIKVDKVNEWIRENGSTEHPETWAYADSPSDIPLLHFVDHPVVVNPKENMVHIAEQHGWPIFPETEKTSRSV